MKTLAWWIGLTLVGSVVVLIGMDAWRARR